jgi:hypothetical protein
MMAEVSRLSGIPMEKMGPDMTPEMEMQVAPMMAEAILKIEEARRTPDPEQAKIEAARIANEGRLETARVVGESRVAATQVASDGRMALADMQHRHDREIEKLKADHALELQESKNAWQQGCSSPGWRRGRCGRAGPRGNLRMSVQMLNAPLEAMVCRAMIAAMQHDLHKAEQDLLTTLLPQERYFQAFAKVNTLRDVVARLEKVYVANFET